MVDNQHCSLGDNLIKTNTNVKSMEECSGLCNNTIGCTAFTYLGPESHLLSEACMLFSSCRQRGNCQDCVTGSSQDDCTCGIPYEGFKNNDNFENLLLDIEDEFKCKSLCKKSKMCKIYTYFNENDPNTPRLCVLLKSQKMSADKAWKCEHCSTGPDTCEVGEECKVSFLSSIIPLFVDKSFDINFETGEKDCFIELNAMAVGSGGKGHYSDYNKHHGGGSGYFKFGPVRLTSKDKVLKIKLEQGGPTTISIGEVEVLKAKEGGPAYGLRECMIKYDHDGCGNGYSGGAGANGYGGFAGGDGTGEHAGKGSGEDVTKIKMKNFSFKSGRLYGGHGGGGILVNENDEIKLYNAGGGGGTDVWDNQEGDGGFVALEFP